MEMFSRNYEAPNLAIEQPFIAMSKAEFTTTLSRQFDQFLALRDKIEAKTASPDEIEVFKSADDQRRLLTFSRSFRRFLMESGWQPPEGE